LIAYQFNSDGTLGAESWNTDTAGKIPAHGSRKIFTMIDTAKVEFKWSALNAGQRTALQTIGITEDRLNWIRGDQSKEKPSGALRQRTRLLGDIVNSDPFYVSGSPSMLYVGANDGMLHAFNAETGVEQFAYIPKAVFPHLSSLSDPGYGHKYFVDGSPIVSKLDNGDLILVGTTGAGGRSVFALDVTDPTGFEAGDVKWEFTDADLGYTLGQPSIGRLKNGTWVAVFGNGYNSDSGKAFLFIKNLTDPNAAIVKIPTNSDTDNGLAKPALLLDADGRIVAAYAGDLKGNLWKFDLTDNTVAFGAALFTAKNASGIAQSITSAPTIGRHPNGG
jgi:type IV pilus assembly protein PilY1